MQVFLTTADYQQEYGLSQNAQHGQENMKFSGNQLLAARDLLGLTQEELAAACEVSVRTLAAVESGNTRPQQQTIAKIGQELTRRGIEFTNGTGIGIRLDYKKAAEYSASHSASKSRVSPTSPALSKPDPRT